MFVTVTWREFNLNIQQISFQLRGQQVFSYTVTETVSKTQKLHRQGQAIQFADHYSKFNILLSL
jgi:hypothetical protein